ncbi:MAG: class II aldolase/adducin family protein [Phycisphaerae bacterium]|nr:class II aldolase/adducin family protein [Phycisphaerae bacterium]
MIDVDEQPLSAFVVAARRVAGDGLVRCSSGNLSQRLDGEHLLVSASQTWLADLTSEQVSICHIADGEHLAGPPASIETRFHAGIFRARPEVNWVLHFQSPAATVLACCDTRPDLNVIIEVPAYIGPVAWVPYRQPGSAELAEAVVAAMETHDMAMLANHGQVTVGATFAETLQRAAFFELACEIVCRGGDAVIPLDTEQIAALRPKGDEDRAV